MNIIIPQEVNDLLSLLEFGSVELNELDVYTICTDKQTDGKVVYKAIVLDSDNNVMLEWNIKDNVNTIYIYDEKWEEASTYDLDLVSMKLGSK